MRAIKIKLFFIDGDSQEISVNGTDNKYVSVSYENVKKIELYNTYDGSNSIYEVDFFGSYDTDLLPTDPDDPVLDAPDNIKNIIQTVTSSSVTFNYDLPTSENFSHLEIYRDMELIVDNHTINSFTDTGLEADKEYFYTFKSVGIDDSVSTGNTVGIHTTIENDITPPAKPTGLDGTEGNSYLTMNWHSNIESDLAGYNLYVNGTQYNTSLIVNNYYTINNLNNGMEYDIEVTAVDTAGNESEKSTLKTFSPTVDALPILSMNYSLKDVAESTENWFSSLWLILAFAVAIPLAFYISNRIKALFLA